MKYYYQIIMNRDSQKVYAYLKKNYPEVMVEMLSTNTGNGICFLIPEEDICKLPFDKEKQKYYLPIMDDAGYELFEFTDQVQKDWNKKYINKL